MSKIFVDDIVEKTSNHGVQIPGHVVQIVQGEHSTQLLSSSSTYAATGVTASITPSSTSSKILVCVQINGVYKDGNNSTGVGIRVKRDSTQIKELASRAGGDNGTGGSAVQSIGTVGGDILDSPSTTSATTYDVDFKATGNTSGAYVQVYGVTSSIVLMEIAQ